MIQLLYLTCLELQPLSAPAFPLPNACRGLPAAWVRSPAACRLAQSQAARLGTGLAGLCGSVLFGSHAPLIHFESAALKLDRNDFHLRAADSEVLQKPVGRPPRQGWPSGTRRYGKVKLSYARGWTEPHPADEWRAITYSSTGRPRMRCSSMIRSSTAGVQEWYQTPSG
jgi:hypothetical protein